MVPSGVGENKLQEAGFMYSMEKSVWYHQGTEFGRRKAENEEKSVEKLVSYLEVGLYLSEKLKILYHFFLLQELRSGGRGAGLNNGLVLLFECAEDFGLVRGLLSSHSADIWSHVVRGVGCIDHYTRQAEIPTTFSPPYYKVCVGGDSKWLTTLTTTTPASSSPLTPTGEQRQVKVEAETRAEMVYNILCDVSGKAPTYDTFIRWYCYPSTSMTMTSLAGNLELQRQLLPLQNHVDRQLFNARVQCVLEVFCCIIMILVASKPVISILVHFSCAITFHFRIIRHVFYVGFIFGEQLILTFANLRKNFRNQIQFPVIKDSRSIIMIVECSHGPLHFVHLSISFSGSLCTTQ